MITISVIVLFAIGAVHALLPSLRPNGLFFSVTVPENYPQSDAAKRILRRYRFAVGAQTAIAIALTVFCEHGHLRPYDAILAGFVWQLLWIMVAYAGARRAVLPESIDTWSVRQASLATRPPEPNGQLWVQFVALIPLAVTAVILMCNWSSLPERYPAHWNLSGHPNRWVAKSAGSVFSLLVVGLAFCSVFAFLSWSIRNRTRRSVQGTSAQMREVLAMRSFVLRVVTATQCFLATLFSALALAPLLSLQADVVLMHAMLVFSGLYLVVLAFWSATAMRSRKLAGVPAGDLTPDRCWKAGIFYWNPEDPALFVEKRAGLGYTFNFARPSAWIFLILLVAVPFVISAMGHGS